MCLGTMYMGWRMPTDMSMRLLDQYVEAGGSFLDTANIYGRIGNERVGGLSEKSWASGCKSAVTAAIYSSPAKSGSSTRASSNEGGHPMQFSEVQVKGLSRCLVAASLDPKKLRFHITEVEAGNRSHAAHTHSGVEAFYMLEGHSTVEVEDECYPLGPNEAIVVDASRPHGIFNSGTTRIKYMVIIVQD